MCRVQLVLPCFPQDAGMILNSLVPSTQGPLTWSCPSRAAGREVCRNVYGEVPLLCACDVRTPPMGVITSQISKERPLLRDREQGQQMQLLLGSKTSSQCISYYYRSSSSYLQPFVLPVFNKERT